MPRTTVRPRSSARRVTAAGILFLLAAAPGRDVPDAAGAVPLPGPLAGCQSRANGSRWGGPGAYVRDAEYGREPNGWLAGVSGIATTSDGRVAVLDGASARVVVLSPSLAQVREFGRRGNGPGELTQRQLFRIQRTLRTFNHVAATESEIYVYDGGAIEVFGWDGAFKRHISGMRGGSFLPFTLRGLQPRPQELLYGFDSLDIAGAKGHRLQTWSVTGNHRRLLAELALPAPPLRGNSFHVSGRQARALWAAGSDCVAMADGASEWVLRMNRLSGRSDTVRLPRHAVPRYREGDDDEEAERLGQLRGPMVRGMGRASGPPTALMRWVDMAVDPDGWLWVQPWVASPSPARGVPVLRVSLQTGRAESDTVPAFPHAFGPPGTFYSLEKDPETDEVLLTRYRMRPPRR